MGNLSDLPAWAEIAARLTRELGEPVRLAEPLTPRRRSRMTWAARAEAAGPLVVKIRYGDRAAEKTQWCAAQLPQLGARGYPVPTILWHGLLHDQWHVMVQNRLPGRPLTALDGPLLDALLGLVERQAKAGIPAGQRDFTKYIANVLFDDWDEFGLGCRALDLITPAFNCVQLGDYAAADRLFERAALIAAPDGLRCLVSYQALGDLAYLTRENDPTAAAAEAGVIAAVLDLLDAAR